MFAPKRKESAHATVKELKLVKPNGKNPPEQKIIKKILKLEADEHLWCLKNHL